MDTPDSRFRDLNILGINSDGSEVYNFSENNGNLYREHGSGAATGEFAIDFDHSSMSNGAINSPIMVKTLKLTRTLATQNTSWYEDDNHLIRNIMDIDLKGWDLSTTDIYVPPVYSISFNQSETDTQGSPVFDIKGNFSNSDIYLYADNTCSDVLVGSATSVSGSTTQVVTNNFDPNDYPVGLLYFYAAVKDT